MVIKMTMKNFALKMLTVMRMMRMMRVGEERAKANHQMMIPSGVKGRSIYSSCHSVPKLNDFLCVCIF